MTPVEALTAIKKFVKGVRLDPVGADFESQAARRTYRRFHALLLWELAVDREGEDPSVRLYFREALSDLATAYFLTFAGIYKAARLSSRGAIENIFRVLAAAAGENVVSLNTIPSLMTACQNSWATTTHRVQVLNSLYVLYGELCNTVHSVAIDYMSLRIPFEKIIEQDPALYKDNIFTLDNLFRLSGESLFLTYHLRLSEIDFRNADYIRDSAAAEIKRAVLDAFGPKV